jgi:hypothetical protein
VLSVQQLNHVSAIEMKFLSLTVIASVFATSGFCQTASIGIPADGTIVQAGSNITVEVDSMVSYCFSNVSCTAHR